MTERNIPETQTNFSVRRLRYDIVTEPSTQQFGEKRGIFNMKERNKKARVAGGHIVKARNSKEPNPKECGEET